MPSCPVSNGGDGAAYYDVNVGVKHALDRRLSVLCCVPVLEVDRLFGFSPIAFRVGLHPTAAILVAAWGVAEASYKMGCWEVWWRFLLAIKSAPRYTSRLLETYPGYQPTRSHGCCCQSRPQYVYVLPASSGQTHSCARQEFIDLNLNSSRRRAVASRCPRI
ncbi:unnamed protein product, partial [Iphiclides podalirius]